MFRERDLHCVNGSQGREERRFGEHGIDDDEWKRRRGGEIGLWCHWQGSGVERELEGSTETPDKGH